MVDRVVVEVSVAEWGGGGDEGGCEEESGVVETSVDMCSGCTICRCSLWRRAVLCAHSGCQVGSELILFFLDPLCFPVHDNDHGFDGPLHDWGTVSILFCERLLLHDGVQGSGLATAGNAHHHHFGDVSVRVAVLHLSLIDQSGTIAT